MKHIEVFIIDKHHVISEKLKLNNANCYNQRNRHVHKHMKLVTNTQVVIKSKHLNGNIPNNLQNNMTYAWCICA